jgi:ParB family chromosome partitioning protein
MSAGASGNRKGGLGRGLGSLIPTSASESPSNPDAPSTAQISQIVPNPYQPRTNIDPSKLETLAESIRIHGVIQPLVVRADGPDRYILIAGERRWRASQLAGLERVPIVLIDAAPRAQLELALVENVVRSDLSPLEEAAAYRQLVEDFGLTQNEVADRVGRSRVSVTNTLRLLTAPEAVQAALTEGTITEGHARALLGLPSAADQVAMLEQVTSRGYTVRQTEDAVRNWVSRSAQARPKPDAPRDYEAIRLEDRFRAALGSRVALKRAGNGKPGSLTIQFHSDEELQALYDRIVGEETW